MALKEKALKRLCEKFAKAGIPFCLTGPWMLSQRGLAIAWHHFDVVVDPEQFPEADRVLTRLGMRDEVFQSDERSEVHYHFDGADIQLYSGFAPAPVRYRLPESMDTVSVLGQVVPLMPPEDWYVLLLQAGKQQEAQPLLTYFQEHPFRPQALAPSLSGYAPDDGCLPIH